MKSKSFIILLFIAIAFQSCAIMPFNDSPDPMDHENMPPQASTPPLSLGMNMSDVKGLWGAPFDVENAGDGSQANQRWAYTDALLNRYGMGATRYVYFERGRVVGWEMPR